MVRRVIQKRQRIPYIIIGCEGKNKTEKSYLTSLYRYLCGRNKYTIKFAPGKHTDPEGIVNDVIRYVEYELDNLQDSPFLAVVI